MTTRTLLRPASLALLALLGCRGKTASNPPDPSGSALATAAPAPPPPVAASSSAAVVEPAPKTELTVPIEARSGSKLAGTATLVEVDGGVRVTVNVKSAPPGKVGCHIHEKDDCSAPDAASAGGHFNPSGHAHGLPDGERHLGDLGNIEVAPDGAGSLEITIQGANLKPTDPNSFVGRAVIVHAKPDDGGQPTGNAGGRIGCGVIHLAH